MAIKDKWMWVYIKEMDDGDRNGFVLEGMVLIW